MGTAEELKREIHQLREQVAGLRRDLVSRASLRWQWRLAAVLVAVGLAVTFTANTITRNLTLRDLRRDVVVCFLQPGRITPRESAACARKFRVRNEYAEQQAAARARIAEYERLKQRVAELERRVR